MATAAVSGGQKMAGCVKWFNMKTGFGFLTVVHGGGSGELKVGSEVFVHHSNVKVQEEQYRFLVQGEYVEFDVSNVANGQHSCQATNVTGMFGGKLMCETRNEMRQSSSSSSHQHQHGREHEESEEEDGGDAYVPVLRRTASSSAPAPESSRSSAPSSKSRGGDAAPRTRGGRSAGAGAGAGRK
jgi:cold shock CspA family protein